MSINTRGGDTDGQAGGGDLRDCEDVQSGRKEVIHILEILCGFFGGVTLTITTIVIVALRWDSKKKK